MLSKIIHMTDKEKLVYAFLQSHKIAFDAMNHHALDTMEACEEVDYHFGDAAHCKNIFLSNRQETEFFLLLVCGDKKFKTAEISKQINKPRLSFGSSHHMLRLLNIQPGSVSPMGLMFDTQNEIQLLIDEDLLKAEKLLVHPCVNTATLCLSMDDLLNVFFKATGHTPTYVKVSES